MTVNGKARCRIGWATSTKLKEDHELGLQARSPQERDLLLKLLDAGNVSNPAEAVVRHTITFTKESCFTELLCPTAILGQNILVHRGCLQCANEIHFHDGARWTFWYCAARRIALPEWCR